MTGLYVQYGCAYSAPPGWVNFDASLTLRFERLPVIGRLYTKNSARFPASVHYGDVVAGLPIESGSCRAVYASHVLEHLCLEDCRRALNETYRILADGGTFRLVVPDLRVFAERYAAADRDDAQAGLRFMEDTSLGTRSRGGSMLQRASRLLGRSQHLWMWDEPSLRAELHQAGFSRVRRAQLGDAADPMFAAAEEPSRFVDACALEARR